MLSGAHPCSSGDLLFATAGGTTARMIFRSPEETVEYAKLHAIGRWMVYGDADGWWPLYTQEGSVNPASEPKARVDISLHRR